MSKRLLRMIWASLGTICLVGASAVWAQGQLEGSGIPYGDEIGALVQAPKGWIFDNQSGVSQGLHCVMYPQGYSWRTAGEVIYVSIGKLKSGQTLEDFVGVDASDFRKKSPGIEIVPLEPITLASGQKALVRGFTGDQFGNHECIAYAQLGQSVASFVLSCRDKDGYDKSAGPFKGMVAQAELIKMEFGDRPEPAREEAVTPSPTSYGYSHWSKFKPGTFVAFRYTMKSAQTSEEMIRTITLKEATPGFIRLDYQEAPAATAKAPVPTPVSLYQNRQEDYGEAEEEFETSTPVESLLGYGIAGYLKDRRGRRIDNGEEEIDWRGGKLRTRWTKLGLGAGEAPMTITVWWCDEVPGGLFRFVREIEGAAASHEEVVVSDLRAIAASPDEIERLRASRQPITIEVPADDYIKTRLRSFRMFSDQIMISPDFYRNLKAIKLGFDADRRRIAAELGPQEASKLTIFLDQLDALFAISVKAGEIMTKAQEQAARGELDEAAAGGIQAGLTSLRDQFSDKVQRLQSAFIALDGVSVKFTKKPS
jgi:hypothetical protein